MENFIFCAVTDKKRMDVNRSSEINQQDPEDLAN